MVFLNSLTQWFICLLHADAVASVFPFLYVFNNLERFMIALCKFLFINLAWLYLTYLSFKGTLFSIIISVIFINQAKLSDCMLWEGNSVINFILKFIVIKVFVISVLDNSRLGLLKYVLRTGKVNLWKSNIPVS